MKSFDRRRLLLALTIYAIAALALGGAALAGATNRHHSGDNSKKKTFAPQIITKAAEVSAVELDPFTQQFVQVTFDRGRVTVDSSSSITIEQSQSGAVWRTQAFTIPSNAVVTLNGRTVQLAQIPTGAHASIESTGAVGGSLSVVRVKAFSRHQAPLPETSS